MAYQQPVKPRFYVDLGLYNHTIGNIPNYPQIDDGFGGYYIDTL